MSYAKSLWIKIKRKFLRPIKNFILLPGKYKFGDFMEEGYEERLISRACTERDFMREDFKEIMELPHIRHEIHHRKAWEFAFVILLLKQYDMLHEGIKGLGFAVGTEPLPSYFANRGVNVLATDLEPERASEKGWVKTGQNCSGNIEELYYEDICERSIFDRKVKFEYLDMNHIPDKLHDYDFCWSCCAIEHVGSLALSKEFLKNMIGVLKPGGIAVHTTEFNLTSNDKTIEKGRDIIYRKKDIQEIEAWCKEHGHQMECSFVRGRAPEDLNVDRPPYCEGTSHLTLGIGRYASTSFAIVIRKKENENSDAASLPEV